jgi:hypothetical protein
MAASRYLVAGLVLLAGGASLAVVLNVMGASCLTNLARLDRSTLQPQAVDDLERNCFIITNSYVYSLFAAAIGAIILAYWRRKKRQYQ